MLGLAIGLEAVDQMMWGGTWRGQCLAVGGLPERNLRHLAVGEEVTNLEAEASKHSETTMDTVMAFTLIYLTIFLFSM